MPWASEGNKEDEETSIIGGYTEESQAKKISNNALSCFPL